MPRVRPRVLFRVAAGPRIGFGHIVRATRVAGAIDADSWLSVRGRAPAIQGMPRRAASSRVSELSRLRVDVLVLDTPDVGDAERWVRAARRRGIAVASIHDLGLAPVRSDLAVNGSIGGTDLPGAARTLAGPRYAIVDPAIASAVVSRRSAPRVLIALGGGPRSGIAMAIAAAIRSALPAVSVDVAGGFTQGHRPTLRRVRWLGPQSSLAPWLRQADVAVVAGGVTLYEAAALGVPAVALAVVPAQRPTIVGMAAAGVTIDSGILLSRSRGTRNTQARWIAGLVAGLIERPRLQSHMGRAGRRLVDGDGVRRVAREFERLAAKRRVA